MKITLYAFGSRGDVQPCVALALGLQQAGHLVTLAAGNNFEAWVRGYGLQFAPIGVDIQAMMQSRAPLLIIASRTSGRFPSI